MHNRIDRHVSPERQKFIEAVRKNPRVPHHLTRFSFDAFEPDMNYEVQDVPLREVPKWIMRIMAMLLGMALLGLAFGMLQGCSTKDATMYDAQLAAEADRNMPPVVELHEPPFLSADIVKRTDGSDTLYEVWQLTWEKSRKFPNGGYQAGSRDGWWFRCNEVKVDKSGDDCERALSKESVYIHESDLRLSEWQPKYLRK